MKRSAAEINLLLTSLLHVLPQAATQFPQFTSLSQSNSPQIFYLQNLATELNKI
jgi:hypothetical protein